MAIQPLEFDFPSDEIGNEGKAEGVPLAIRLIREKYQGYLRASRLHKNVYIATRLLAGLSAALLPFAVGTMPMAATSLSVMVVICIVIDTVFDPKGKWTLYSRATDLLAIAELKRRGEYDNYKAALEILLTTEQQALSGLKGLEEVLSKVQQAKKSEAA